MAALDRPLADSDDDTIAAALELSVLPPLLAALAGDLDDPSLAPDHLRPDLSVLMDPTFGLSAEQVAEGRRLAMGGLQRLRERPPQPVRALPLDELRALLAFVTGGAASDDYLELLRDELALGEDLRAPTWRREEVAPDRPFRIAVIGAGMSGLVAAHRLHQAGVEVVVLEKNDDVGGTWLENSYPGCRVDVSNLFYCYSFAQRDDWPQHFSTQEVLLDYFRGVADEHGLRPLIRFGTEVLAAELDEASMAWTLQLRELDGSTTELTVDAVVSGVGQLNRPPLPATPFTPPGGITTSTSAASASSSSAPGPARPSSSPRSPRRPPTSRSSSAPRPGSSRLPTTTMPSSPRWPGSCATCRAMRTGCGSGTSGRTSRA
jgi:4-hydroxyacetophenone monooxygenase